MGGAKVTGVDVSENAIENAIKNFKQEGISFIKGNAEKLEFLNEEFDIIVSLETMEHVANVSRYIQELKRVLKKDGIIIISCPNDWWYYPDEIDNNPYHLKKYTFNEFVELTTKILGESNQLFCAHKAEGFLNLEISEMATGCNQKSMLNMNSICGEMIPPDRNIPLEQACYYVAVWDYSMKNRLENNFTIFPSVFNPRGTEAEVELREMLADARHQIEEWRKTCSEIEKDAERSWNTCKETEVELRKIIKELEQHIEELSKAKKPDFWRCIINRKRV